MRSLLVILLLVVSRVSFGQVADSTHVDSVTRLSNPGSQVQPIGIDRNVSPHVWEIVTNLPSDWWNWGKQNLRPKFWPQATAITISTAALIVYDSELWAPIYKQYKRGGGFADVADVFSYMGDGKSQFGLAGAFAAYGFIAGDKRALRTAAQTCEAILACGAVVQLLKHTTGRESPFVATTKTGRWDFFPNQIDYAYHVPHYDAFPSGHLATALTTVTVIANNYAEIKWLKPVGYAICAAISTGLVAQGIHWWSDFPLSIALGIGFGNLISPDPDRDMSAKEPNEQKDVGSTLLDNMSLFPIYQNGAAALAMSVRF